MGWRVRRGDADGGAPATQRATANRRRDMEYVPCCRANCHTNT